MQHVQLSGSPIIHATISTSEGLSTWCGRLVWVLVHNKGKGQVEPSRNSIDCMMCIVAGCSP